MTELQRFKNALEDKTELMQTKFKEKLKLDEEITKLRIDIMKMEKKLNEVEKPKRS